MKNGMIIKLLVMMYTVCARLELSDIKTIGDSVVIEEDNLLIHPDGPLNPLRGYIMHKSGNMYNKRLYGPEINTMYKLEKKYENGETIYAYTREPVNDLAYDDICEDKEKNEYLTQSHALLVKMFPSTDGSFSIVSGRQDSIYSFLIKDRVKPECMHIMAALFLLSEQVDVPFTIETKKKEKKLVLKSADGTTAYINQPRTNENLLSLIEFLKKYINNEGVNPSAMKGLFTAPTTYEQFMTGEFLNTSQFLIQSYIYEFIDTKENYIKFVEAVYTLLNDQIKNKKSYERVLNKCFIQESVQSNEIDHTKNICDLKDTIDKYKIFPFMDSSQLPSYTRVKAYDREKGEFINNESRKYSNCVEAGILGLVCCLVYDPNKKKYNTDHLPDNKETKPLKDFFKKYTEPRETTDYEMHEDWCRVVADLKNDKILYLKEKTNELDSSLLNILYVLSNITGSKEEVVKEIKHLEELLADKKINDKLDIEESLTTIFKELSNNKNLEIECDEFTVGTRKDNNLDLFGEFKLVYTFNKKKNGILVEITPGHSSLSLLEDLLSSEDKNIIKEKLTEIQNTYSNIESYTAYTIRQYINIELAKMEQKSVFSRIQESIKNNHDNINGIFLYGMIRSVEQKARIVKYFLAVHVNNTLPKNNSLVRFTNNLIGSTPLDDSATRRRMLFYYILNKDSNDYYPRIGSCWEEITRIALYNFYTIINGILHDSDYSIDVKLECFKKLMMVLANHSNKHAIITSLYLINDIVDCSRKTNELTKTFLEFIKIIDETVMQPDGSNMFCIYLRWIVIIGSDSYCSLKDKKEIIKTLMDQIDVNYNLNLDNIWDSWIRDNYFDILKNLEMSKNLFCDDEESPEIVEKYDYLIEKIKSALNSANSEVSSEP